MSLPPYQFSVDGFAPDHFRVRSFTGKEAVSEAYSFDLVVTCDAESDAVERTALGQRAVLVFNVGEAPRAFYGIIASMRLDEVHYASQSVKYGLRFVPRLWLLKRKQRTRIFQKMRVPEIVAAVLREAGISTRWQITHAYPEREYTTQYEETDYRFIKRILAEAGIYFYFPQGPALDGAAFDAGSVASAAAAAIGEPLIPGDTVICADDAVCYPPLRSENAASLAASTAAALALAAGSALGAGRTVGAVIGSVAAASGMLTADLARSGGDVPTLRVQPSEGGALQTQDRVTSFTLRNSVRSNAAAFREYDPERPMVRLESKATSSQPFPESALETAATATSAVTNLGIAAAGLVAGVVNTASAALGQSVPSEVYEHHSPFLFPKWAFASDEAPRILRQKRRRASIATGEGACSDLCAGHRFLLEEHPAAHLDGAYVVVSVEHRGETRAESGRPFTIYWNTFECAPAEMTYVPPRPKRTSVQVSLTAIVVGPAGEEIHVDDRGQIRVQFHWDREGKYDERSSCWIRTMQPWAGATWGHQFIPRVGMEVVVVFEGGDPDKPMVLGALYNGTHPPPFLLPGDKTRSGWRTQSSPGGSGFNELSFQDAAGTEQIYVHAQRNLDEKVGKNHTLLVQNDEFLRILGNRLDTIEKNLESVVKGDQTSHVDGNRIDVVKGNFDERISGMAVTRVEGNERRGVTGRSDLTLADDYTVRVKGCYTTIVGRDDARRSYVLRVEGTGQLSSSGVMEIDADKGITLKCGKSFIKITADKIEIVAPSVSAKGEGGGIVVDNDIKLNAKGDAVLKAKSLLVKTEAASMSLKTDVQIDGKKILLNSPDQVKDPVPDKSPPPTLIQMKDQLGKPLANQRFVITMGDGSEYSGVLDSEGKTEMPLDGSGTIRFPDLAKPS